MYQSHDSGTLVRRMSRYCDSAGQNHDYEIVRSKSYSSLYEFVCADRRQTFGLSNNFRLTSFAPKGISFVILSNRH